MAGVDSEYLHGIAKLPERLVILLDLDRVLAREERRALESRRLISLIDHVPRTGLPLNRTPA